MAKKIQINVYLVLVYILVVMTLFIIAFFGIKDANACLSNPFVYGAQQGETEKSGHMFCSCSFQNPLFDPLYFNHENISLDREQILTGSFSGQVGGNFNG